MNKELMAQLKEHSNDTIILQNLYHSILGSNLNKFIKVYILRGKTPLEGKINLYRKLLQFEEEVWKKIDSLQEELSQESFIEMYFPEESEFVITDKETKKVVVKKMSTNAHWNRALKQRQGKL